MQIQYAMLANNISFLDKSVSINSLVREVETDIVGKIEYKWPMYVSLLDGTPGKHRFFADLTSPDGRVAPACDTVFHWPSDTSSHVEFFTATAQPKVYGVHTLRLYVDGESLETIPIPVERATCGSRE